MDATFVPWLWASVNRMEQAVIISAFAANGASQRASIYLPDVRDHQGQPSAEGCTRRSETNSIRISIPAQTVRLSRSAQVCPFHSALQPRSPELGDTHLEADTIKRIREVSLSQVRATLSSTSSCRRAGRCSPFNYYLSNSPPLPARFRSHASRSVWTVFRSTWSSSPPAAIFSNRIRKASGSIISVSSLI